MAKKRKKALAKLDEAARAGSKGVKRTKKAARAARAWLGTARAVSEDDVRRVVEHGVSEADSLLASAQGWLVKLAKRIRLAYDMLVAWWMGRFEFPKATVTALTLALLYFINPFDLIPDMLPVIGVVDEAMVFAFVARMMSDDAKRYAKKMGLKLKDVGL